MLPELNENADLPPGVHIAGLLFSHLQAGARYGASVFWFSEGALPKEFLRAWQLKRDGTLRGILEVG